MMSIYHALGSLFGWLMKIIYDLVQNYGVAILLFTLCTRIILFPITYKQMKNSSKMQLINPKLEKIKKSYKNNPEKIQEEQMKLYAEEGINPMASCLPMLVQFVILFGVLDVVYRPLHHIMKISSDIVSTAKTALIDAGMTGLSKSEGLRDELYILNASQNSDYSSVLSQIDGIKTNVLTDFYEKFQVFGIHLGEQPTLHPTSWNYESIMLCLIPFIAGLLQLILTVFSQIQQKRTNPDMQQMKGMNTMMYIMPIFSVWFAFMVPAGVGFYWICSSLFSLIQTIGLNLYFTKDRMILIAEKEKEKNKKKQKSGKKSLYQQLLEQQNAQNTNLNQHKSESEAEREGMSRKEVSAYNRKILDQQRAKLDEKYGNDVDSNDRYSYDSDEDSSDELAIARKRMADKYGDKY